MTAQATLTAVLAALNATLPDSVPAHDIDAVPSPRPAEYVTALLLRRAGARLNAGGSTGVVGYRLRVRAASQTEAENVRKSLETCRAALEFKRLTVGSQTSTPIQFETEDDVDGDDGWFAAYDDYTFAL